MSAIHRPTPIDPADLKPRSRPRPVRVVDGPLRTLLIVILGLFALLSANSLYLGTVTFLGWLRGETRENYFYQLMFLAHVAGGLLLVTPVVAFGVSHWRKARARPKVRAKIAGYSLLGVAVGLLVTGIALTQVDVGWLKFGIRDPGLRRTFYWIHVIAPAVAAWLFALHRFAGRRIRWHIGMIWAAVALIALAGMSLLHRQDPRRWNLIRPAAGEKYFEPSFARTQTNHFISERALSNDTFCLECHAEIHKSWSHSAHRYSSFDNPAYAFALTKTREKLQERDGNTNGAKFCAGCHDPVALFAGKFDEPRFQDAGYDLSGDSLASVGISCSVCHSITSIDSTRGNADYTIDDPPAYPFTYSENSLLKWLNRQLIRARPAMHAAAFRRPLHSTAEFCGACHKMHVPAEVGGNGWVRGQNHYDSFLSSAFSGGGIRAFHFPDKANRNCNECHMPWAEALDPAARPHPETGGPVVHDHLFPAGNTALPHWLKMPEWVHARHEAFLGEVVRVDLFGLHKGGLVENPLLAPLRPALPELQPGTDYLIETVIRTLNLGHALTEGTADSNELWLDVIVKSGDRILGRSGGLDPARREVDPWSHFVNAFVIDRNGQRVDRRNIEDMLTTLYDHQIPSGASDVVHYRFRVPRDLTAPVTFEVKLRYRKFDSQFLSLLEGARFSANNLPILTLAGDSLTLPVAGIEAPAQTSAIPEWQRWNDYGIGLLRKGGGREERNEYPQAAAAFEQVIRLGQPDGHLNAARVALEVGRFDDALMALRHAKSFTPAAPLWSLLYWNGVTNRQIGQLDDAKSNFIDALELDTAIMRERGIDFRRDVTLLVELASTLIDRAKQERTAGSSDSRDALLRQARESLLRALDVDSENAVALTLLAEACSLLATEKFPEFSAQAEQHRQQAERYQPKRDEVNRALSEARLLYPAAAAAAERIVVYELQRPGGYELPAEAAVER